MKISIDWLKDFIDIDLPASALIDKLDMIGMVVEEWEEKNSDIILDIETYANRPDTLGHLGIAREIAAALGMKMKERQWPLVELEQETSERGLLRERLEADRVTHEYSLDKLQQMMMQISEERSDRGNQIEFQRDIFQVMVQEIAERREQIREMKNLYNLLHRRQHVNLELS